VIDYSIFLTERLIMKKTIYLVLIFLSAWALFPFAGHERGAEGFNPWPIDDVIGNKAPDIKVEDLNGNKVRLSSFKGKTVLLNFWATWCPYCRKERPHLDELHKQYKGKDFVILSVSIDRSKDSVKRFLKKMPADFIILFDGSGSAASEYNVMGLPTSYLISSKGIVKHKFPGYVDWTNDSYRELIDKLISE
jgi:peroxiredoxin